MCTGVKPVRGSSTCIFVHAFMNHPEPYNLNPQPSILEQESSWPNSHSEVKKRGASSQDGNKNIYGIVDEKKKQPSVDAAYAVCNDIMYSLCDTLHIEILCISYSCMIHIMYSYSCMILCSVPPPMLPYTGFAVARVIIDRRSM